MWPELSVWLECWNAANSARADRGVGLKPWDRPGTAALFCQGGPLLSWPLRLLLHQPGTSYAEQQRQKGKSQQQVTAGTN
jgi:hypothetical protein